MIKECEHFVTAVTKKLYNFQREVLDSTKTKPWKVPSDIAQLVSEDLVLTDYFNRSVNVIKENWIE